MAHPRFKKNPAPVIGNTACNNFSLFTYFAFFQITVVLYGPGFMGSLYAGNYKCDSFANFEIITDELNPSDGGRMWHMPRPKIQSTVGSMSQAA
jgi:hypothetical protein